MLIAHIIDHIRDGFETELRMHRRRTSALLAASGGGPAVIAIAPLVESRYCKWAINGDEKKHIWIHIFRRNSIPGPEQRKQSSYSSQSSSTSSAANPGAFLRAELANLTRKLSNLWFIPLHHCILYAIIAPHLLHPPTIHTSTTTTVIPLQFSLRLDDECLSEGRRWRWPMDGHNNVMKWPSSIFDDCPNYPLFRRFTHSTILPSISTLHSILIIFHFLFEKKIILLEANCCQKGWIEATLPP